jgi:hypothetical protein
LYSSRADLVDRALAEADDVKRVKADLGLRDRFGDRLLIAAAHVDRHRPDRVAAVAKDVEELLQGGGLRPGAHHTIPPVW